MLEPRGIVVEPLFQAELAAPGEVVPVAGQDPDRGEREGAQVVGPVHQQPFQLGPAGHVHRGGGTGIVPFGAGGGDHHRGRGRRRGWVRLAGRGPEGGQGGSPGQDQGSGQGGMGRKHGWSDENDSRR